jgi:hypothetical protein
MSEKGANIDLLFRNGLKDYEVLPPPGVWEGIHSGIKIKSRPVFILLRVAAVITVLVAGSYFTYRWSREITSSSSGPALSFNIQASSPEIFIPVVQKQYSPSEKSTHADNYTSIVNEPVDAGSIQEVSEEDSSPLTVLNIRKIKSLVLADSYKASKSFPNSGKTFQLNSINNNLPDLQYLPDNITEKRVNRWSVAAMASPTYFSKITSGTDELSSQLISSEQQLFSYSGGVSFSYKLSKRFSIQSGLYYSSLGQKVDGINSFSGFGQYNSSKGDHSFEVATATGTVYTSNPDVFLSSPGTDRIVTAYTNDVFDPKKANLQPVNSSLSQNFSYLEFPVVLRYKIVDKTIGINLIGGLSYNLLVHNAVYTTLNGSIYPVGDTKGLNPLSLSSSLGMGMEYNISGKLSLNLEPTFRYYINPFSVSTGSFIHPYSFGIFSGVSYKF